MVMISLFSSILLAAAAFAFPTSIEPRFARRTSRSLQRSQVSSQATTNSTSRVVDSNNWAGAAWDSDTGGTFTSVTGTFKVPTPKGPDGSASVWVGIDGDTCYAVILQTGIYINIKDGSPSYSAWYEWYPDYADYFRDISINAGDEIRLTVTVTSANSGKAKVENLTTKEDVEQVFQSQSTALCQQNAEWIVEDYSQNNANVPFCDFGTLEFTDAYATTTSGANHRVTPDGADVIIMQKNGKDITSVHEKPHGVTIKYL